MPKLILSNGSTCLVDAAELHWLQKFTWHCTDTGYAYRRNCADGRQANVRMHREIMQAPTGKSVDHINGNRLDNRKSNLRIVSQKTNSRNRCVSKNNTSGYPGVRFHARLKKWQVYMRVNYVMKYFGCYEAFDEAIKVRKDMETRYGFITRAA